MYRRFYAYGIAVKEETIKDILERRRNGHSLEEIAAEYENLTKSQINAIIAMIEQ